MAYRSRAVSISRSSKWDPEDRALSLSQSNHQGPPKGTSPKGKGKGHGDTKMTLRGKIKKAYDFRKHITSQFQKAMNQCIFIRIEGIIFNGSGTRYQKRVKPVKFSPDPRNSDGSEMSLVRPHKSLSVRSVSSTFSTIRERFGEDDPKGRGSRPRSGAVAFAQDSYRDVHKLSRMSAAGLTRHNRANKTFTPRKSIVELDAEVRRLDGTKNVTFPALEKKGVRKKEDSLYHKVIEDQTNAREMRRKAEQKKKAEEKKREKRKKLKAVSEVSNEESFKDVISLDLDIPTTSAYLGPLRVSDSSTGSTQFYDVMTADEEYDREYQMAISTSTANMPMSFLTSLMAPLFSYNLPEIFISRPRNEDEEDQTNNKLTRSWSWSSNDSSQEQPSDSSLERSFDSSPERSLDSSPDRSISSSPELPLASGDLSLPAVAMATYSRLVAELNVQESDPTTPRRPSYVKRKMDRNAHSSISMDSFPPSTITIDELCLQPPAPHPSPDARHLEYELWKAREQVGGLRRLNCLLKARNHKSTTKTEQKTEDAQTIYRKPIKTIILILPVIFALLIGILSGKCLL